MFGDIGHGFLLFLFALYLCLYKDYILEKYSSMFLLLKIRYLLLLMGLYATYCGLIYNDMMSMPINLFGSCYATSGDKKVSQAEDCVYPFGIDPKWYVSSNELNFFNSLKMKTAVLYGVAQMSLGICLKGLNCIHKSAYIDFFFEFIPQIVFLLCLFGFMDLLIILKWLTDWTGQQNLAPSIIS